MSLRNRVTPLGDIIATPERGLVYGNRGCLHDAGGELRRPSTGRRWIACRLQFRGPRRAPLMAPGRYTELFFLDEATALAAGHRPCAECRREDYRRLTALWAQLHPGQRGADAIDAQLHTERLDLHRQHGANAGHPRRLHAARFEDLPDGSFVLHAGEAFLVRGAALRRWTPGGYDTALPRPAGGPALVITPPSLVALLRARWTPVVPLLHPSAR